MKTDIIELPVFAAITEIFFRQGFSLEGAFGDIHDDPIRAIRAAREIHELVDSMSPEVEKSIGRPISMHTGINTGLVVTGEVDMEKGTHGVAGDTINLASRLQTIQGYQ